MSDGAAPADRHIAEAIGWLVKFEAGGLSPEESLAFNQWRAQSPLHALAWQRLGRASQQFAPVAGLRSEQALYSLDAAERRLRQKRRTLKTLAAMGGLGATLWLSRDHTGAAQAGRYLYGQALADISTAVGEQKHITLADGGKLTLNTQSALDVDFDARPQLSLHFGELAMEHSGTAQLRAGDGLFTPAAGSDFSLFRQGGDCTLRVVAGRVNCILGTTAHLVGAGEGLARRGGEVVRFAVSPLSLSWRQGLLSAERTALGDFVAQLARYRPGHLSCADEIAALTLSGSFPIADTDAILENLCQILPVRQQRLGRYWVRLMPA
ncbi:MAG: DUF4880 domain-containing protein [Porticoccaceae bacterium]